MNKCIFLDRDGVLNRERGEYTYELADFELLPQVIEALEKLRNNQYLLIVITNQAGISRGIYSRDQMERCHEYLKQQCSNRIDAIYFCPYHPTVSASIARKPDTLMFEKAIAKFNIDVGSSWMIGDKERDVVPAKSLGIRTVLVGQKSSATTADYTVDSLYEAVTQVILK